MVRYTYRTEIEPVRRPRTACALQDVRAFLREHQLHTWIVQIQMCKAVRIGSFTSSWYWHRFLQCRLGAVNRSVTIDLIGDWIRKVRHGPLFCINCSSSFKQISISLRDCGCLAEETRMMGGRCVAVATCLSVCASVAVPPSFSYWLSGSTTNVISGYSFRSSGPENRNTSFDLR